MLAELIAFFDTEIMRQALRVVWRLWPLWGAALALRIAVHLWLSYKRREWIAAQAKVLLEVKLPTEQFKSPAAMEVAVQALHQSGVGSLTDVYLKGRVRTWASLELVSDGGQVHFYIWCFASVRRSLENALYSQFPNIEIHEAPDYALGFHHDAEKYKFGKFSHMILTKADAYPIKTYIDYGLEKDPKEEYKNDPIAPVIEFLGSLKPGEHAWIQILIRAHVKEVLKYGRLIPRPDWKGQANEEIKKILKEAKLKPEDAKENSPRNLSPVQTETIKAIERSLEKPAFDAMIRVAYFAEKDAFNPAGIGGILGTLKQFSSQTWNGFKPSWWDFDYPWQDVDLGHMGSFFRKKERVEREALEAYKRRAHFYEPFHRLHDDKPFILTTEEVATLYHFPSAAVAATPTLARIPSKKAEAPANLPV